MSPKPAAVVRFFRARFRAAGTPERARAEKAYLKSALRFHGVTVPDVRRAAAELVRSAPELTRADLRAAVDALYATDYHDLRSAAVAVLELCHDLLAASDAAWLIDLVRRSGNWAHVDWLATKVLGALVARSPELLARLPVWARDDDFWVRRTALLTQLEPLRRGGGDFELFARIDAPLLPEREFFIRKAIGWVLREVSKRRPELTAAFLREHLAHVSGLTLREGSKYLPATLRGELVRKAERATAPRRGR